MRESITVRRVEELPCTAFELAWCNSSAFPAGALRVGLRVAVQKPLFSSVRGLHLEGRLSTGLLRWE